MRRKAMGLALRLLLSGVLLAACDVPEPTSPPPVVQASFRPPAKPGDSINRTMMCSCHVCEPADCCRELEKEQPEASGDCSDGYDFSKCEMKVESCESNCFQHRWRARVEQGCDASRPEQCCHASADF